MNHIIKIQSIIRTYIQSKRYTYIYSKIYRIQTFILDRNDRKHLLKNITYLAKFATSKNKADFLQNKAKQTITKAITKVTIEHKEEIHNAQTKIKELEYIVTEKDKYIHLLEKQNKDMSNHLKTLHTKLELFTQKYNESTNSNGSLRHINDSLEDMNIGLCTKIGDIYLDLSKTTEELQKHKHKTVWDVLFNRVK